MMKSGNQWRVTIIVLGASLFAAACSTPPKNPGELYDLRSRAESQLDLGNKSADRGDYETALVLLNESFRLAVISDDPGLLVRAGLSRGNVLFALERRDEARAAWGAALGEAETHGNRELQAVSRLHIARGRLLAGGKAEAAAVREEAGRELANIKADRLYTAFGWLVVGQAERDMGRYREAEASVRRSLEIHEKERSFEQAAYDWYLIASIRSLGEQYDGALQALDFAIAFDRRAENSWGLATDWRAVGDVRKKSGKDDEAREAYLRSAAIFRALGEDDEAAGAESRAHSAE
jgi:tetratricopeptide (TPR) repeat protein